MTIKNKLNRIERIKQKKKKKKRKNVKYKKKWLDYNRGTDKLRICVFYKLKVVRYSIF